jgi:hypothetical protein
MRLTTVLAVVATLIAAGGANRTDASPVAPGSEECVLVVRPGDTLARLLDSAGVEDAAAAARLFRPTALRPGDEVAIRLGGTELAAFRARPRSLECLTATLGVRDEVALAID